MKNIKIHLLLFSFFVSITAYAQVPGYLGKRFSIGYSNYFSPRLTKLGQELDMSDKNISTKHLFNSTHCLDMDYVLGSRASLCLSGQFSKIDLFKAGATFYANRGSGSNNVLYAPRPKEDMHLNTINISLGFKFFKKGSLNPYGRYRKLELILLVNMIKMDAKGFYSTVNDNGGNVLIAYPLKGGADKFNSLVLAYTIGKQRIFFDKLVLDWGIRFGINYSYIFRYINPVILEDETPADKNSMESQLKESGNIRVWGAQSINAHIGLRFLAF